MYYENIMLVISSRGEFYDKFIKYYWIPFINFVEKKNNNKLKIILIFNNIDLDDLNIPNNNFLKFKNIENFIPGILQKTIDAFEYINKNYKYNKILRTNLSSFFIYENLIAKLKFLDNNNLYHGVIGDYKTQPFISGALFTISKDVVEFIINNKNNLNYNLIDDVAIGYLLTDFKKLNGYRYNILNNTELPDISNLNKFVNDIEKYKSYHVRIYNNNQNFRSTIDIEIIKFLVNKYYL